MNQSYSFAFLDSFTSNLFSPSSNNDFVEAWTFSFTIFGCKSMNFIPLLLLILAIGLLGYLLNFFFVFFQSRNVVSGGNVGRSAFLNEALSMAPHYSTDLGRLDSGLGFLRGYLTSIAAGKGFVTKLYSSDLNFVLANPRIRRFLSTEAPKKKSRCYGLCFILVDMLGYLNVSTFLTHGLQFDCRL